MITNISITSVFVKDVDESKRFYTEVLGFAEKDDITLGDGYRWCTVVHPNQPELQVQGVEFIQEPEERPYGVEAVCRDNSGNWMVLVEPRAWTEEDFA